LVGTTRYQGGVLVVVLISILWEGVYEGSLDAQTMGVDEGYTMEFIMGVHEGNSMIMSSTWLCLLLKIVRLSMEP
jgi:hypothetical protein